MVTCRLTACTPGSAPGPTLGIEYGKPLPFYIISNSGLLLATVGLSSLTHIHNQKGHLTELSLVTVKMNQHARYRVQRSFYSKIIVHSTQAHACTQRSSLPGHQSGWSFPYHVGLAVKHHPSLFLLSDVIVQLSGENCEL